MSVHTLSAYRNYLMSEQVIIPYSIENPEEYTDGQIVQEYLKQLGANILKEKTVHFGKRSRETSYLSSTIGDMKNIEWFRGTYSEERWREMVVTARKSAHEKHWSRSENVLIFVEREKKWNVFFRRGKRARFIMDNTMIKFWR